MGYGEQDRPERGGTGRGRGDEAGARREAAIDRVNRAGVEELSQAYRVGPYTAGRIVQHRERHGPFRTFEDLLNISCVGPEAVESLREWAQRAGRPASTPDHID